MKIAYIGIDLLYPALEALEDSGCEIAEIFSCRTDNVTEFNTRVCGFAKERGIPLHLDKITVSDIRRLADAGCKMAVCGGYYYRIPVREDILPVVNIHPALLPIGRGAWPMPVTILKGLRESGVTLHKMTEAFDEGDILLQETITVSPEDDLETLMEKYWALLPGMMRRLTADFDSLYENAVPQGGENTGSVLRRETIFWRKAPMPPKLTGSCGHFTDMNAGIGRRRRFMELSGDVS